MCDGVCVCVCLWVVRAPRWGCVTGPRDPRECQPQALQQLGLLTAFFWRYDPEDQVH